MAYSANDLELIEMLTYIDGDVLEAAGIPEEKFKIKPESDIGVILSCFDDEALNRLREHTESIDGALASGPEWASIIETIKSREDLCDLEVDSFYPSKGTKLGICYLDPNDNSAGPIVTFKGTTGYREWSDNILGMNTADTPCQQEALDYINELEKKGYKDITVVGHSKGGNKAMYVTICSDSISRCVSFDGQGMSNQFMNKYKDRIKDRSDKIINISLENDYVHILLLQMSGIQTEYVKGYGVDGFLENHSPNSFFVTDGNGKLMTDDEGHPYFEPVEQDNPNMEMITGLTKYIMDNASADELQRLDSYLAPIIGEALGNQDTGATWELLLDDQDTLAMLLGLTLAYIEENDIPVGELVELLDDVGVPPLWRGIIGIFLEKKLYLYLDDFVDLFGIDTICGIDMEIIDKVNTYKERYEEVSDNGIVRDYTDEFRSEILSILKEINSEKWYDVTKWDVWYRAEDGLGHLDISNYTNNINDYYRKKLDIEDETESGVNKIFDSCIELDDNFAELLLPISDGIEASTGKMAALKFSSS